MVSHRKTSTRKILIMVLLFLSVLTLLRLIWFQHFTLSDHPVPFKGELDLRQWDLITQHVIPLDGEWQFFPNSFLMEPGKTPSSSHIHSLSGVQGRTVKVPGDWLLDSDESTPYGFGSYRLRILVDPEQGSTYGIRIPDVKSSSAVYVNGELLAQSGVPAETAQEYTPLNAPYTAFFTVDTDEIELVILVSNYDDPFSGGIARSIKFGLADPFIKETNFATNIVIIACSVYMLHALYGFILSLMGKRDKRLFYFSLVIVFVILGTLIGERLLFTWLPFNYIWSNKVTFLAMIGGGYSLFQSIKHLLPKFIYTKLFVPYSLLSILAVLLILFLPNTLNLSLRLFYTGLMLIPCILSTLAAYRAVVRVNRDNIFLLLAIVAAIYSLIWLLVLEAYKIEIISYPIDLIVATVCLAMYWFKQYHHLIVESQQLAAELQEADRQKDDFLMVIGHEMRNPLHGIINISQSLAERENERLDDRSRQDLKLLTTVSRSMSVLINDLLDLVKLKENRLSIQPKNVELHRLVEAVLDMFRIMISEKSIKLVNRIPFNFPPVHADENRLIQILFNLLHNAEKHSQADEILIEASVVNKKAQITVTDNGIGINESFLDKIFEPYQRAAHHRGEGSLGIGLSICKHLVEMHGGTMAVSSNADQGTAFKFTLPLAPVSKEDLRSAEATVASSVETKIKATQGNDRDGRGAVFPPQPAADLVYILAVDDDPINLKVLKSMFLSPQYEIVTVLNGHDALEILNKRAWDLIIADVMMPDLSGYELTRKIREQYSIIELPILLLTARSEPEDIVAGFLSGANDYVTKPIERLELQTRIQTLIDLKQSVSKELRMEAAWLQAQIQPHFLFNTISTIASLSDIDTARMTALLIEFGNYLKRSFDPKNLQRVIPLKDELDLLHSYLFIEKERFGERLKVVWQIDEKIDVSIPPLTIQPLVENAVKHGILKRIEGGTIWIRIIEKKDTVEMSIRDDGVGIEETKIRQFLLYPPIKEPSIGLYNTHRRLKRINGEGLRIKSVPGEGTTVFFHIPKVDDKEKA